MLLEITMAGAAERMTSATVDVRIVDQSQMDAPAPALAAHRIGPVRVEQGRIRVEVPIAPALAACPHPSINLRVHAAADDGTTQEFLNTSEVLVPDPPVGAVRIEVDHIQSD